MIERYPTKKIFVGNVAVGGDAPISVQSMTFSKTQDTEGTIDQIKKLHFAGADIVRVSTPNKEDVQALKIIKKAVDVPIVADIHFKHKVAILAAEVADCIRINPGNIGSKEKVKAVVQACRANNVPIRIGVNAGSLEKQFDKYGQSHEGMVESALYNIKYLEDLGFTNMKISLKASDVDRTIKAYSKLRPLVEYPFHLGVTEAGTLMHASVKSAMALGHLLRMGIGDTMRISITGALEEEILVAKSILRASGAVKTGVNIISCPTCSRLESNLVNAVKIVEEQVKDIKAPLNISVMGCAVNALGEAKHADVAIAFGKNEGMIIKKGKLIAKLKEDVLIPRFLEEVKKTAEDFQLTEA